MTDRRKEIIFLFSDAGGGHRSSTDAIAGASEAFIAGLPLIIYSRLVEPDDGDASDLADQRAGEWAPNPAMMAATQKKWLDDPKRLAAASVANQKPGKPQAARQIAKLLEGQFFAARQNQHLLPTNTFIH